MVENYDKVIRNDCEEMLNKNGLVNKTIVCCNKDIYGKFIEDCVNKINSNSSGNFAIPTGISSLDKAIGGGLMPGLYVIGACPSAGKTSLVTHIMINLALQKVKCIFFNLDMSEIQACTKLLSNYSYNKSKQNELKKFDINFLVNPHEVMKNKEDIAKLHYNFLKDINNYIDIHSIDFDSRGILNDKAFYVQSVKKSLENMQTAFSDNQYIIVIDYLQLMKNEEIFDYDSDDLNCSSTNKRVEIDEIVQKLKLYSNVYKVPIIVITSINRASYIQEDTNYSNNRYDLSFAKESGSIEYKADMIIRLTEEKSNNGFRKEKRKRIGLNICKSRFGKQDITVELDFIPEYSYFEEVES